jgi:glycosyltransferase involved in cell wall biosynthesis
MAAAAWARVPVRIASRRETAGLRSRIKKRLERCAYRLAHTVVTNAEAVRRHLIAEGVPAEKTVTIYNGVDTERFLVEPGRQRHDLLASWNLPPERRFVTIVANLRHTVKDHPTFLRAAQRIKCAVPNAAFVLAGEGELLQPMRALAAQLGLAQDTFFLGRCGRVAELLALSDVCVLSSLAEGFSNAILEYMAAARPVVATDAGGAREAIQEGDTGFVVPVGDDRALATRIIELLQAPEQASAMGERGRRLVRQKFSCASQLAHTQELYDRLLRRTDVKLQKSESEGCQATVSETAPLKPGHVFSLSSLCEQNGEAHS